MGKFIDKIYAGKIWAIENDRGAWLVEVGASVTFERHLHRGSAIAHGVITFPIRTNAYGVVTHLKVGSVEGEPAPILVPVSNFRSVQHRAYAAPRPQLR